MLTAARVFCRETLAWMRNWVYQVLRDNPEDLQAAIDLLDNQEDGWETNLASLLGSHPELYAARLPDQGLLMHHVLQGPAGRGRLQALMLVDPTTLESPPPHDDGDAMHMTIPPGPQFIPPAARTFKGRLCNRVLPTAGSGLAALNYVRQTPLICAAMAGDAECLQYLLTKPRTASDPDVGLLVADMREENFLHKLMRKGDAACLAIARSKLDSAELRLLLVRKATFGHTPANLALLAGNGAALVDFVAGLDDTLKVLVMTQPVASNPRQTVYQFLSREYAQNQEVSRKLVAFPEGCASAHSLGHVASAPSCLHHYRPNPQQQTEAQAQTRTSSQTHRLA